VKKHTSLDAFEKTIYFLALAYYIFAFKMLIKQEILCSLPML